MTHEEEYAKAKAMVEQLHMGLKKHLEDKPGILKVEQIEKRPVERPVLIAWEQRNTTLLPEDLKNFYMTTNGFDMTWSVKMQNGPLPVGRLHVHDIGQLVRLNPPTESISRMGPSLNDLDSDDDSEESSKPKFGGGCKMFELDSCDDEGKVCLIYREPDKTSGELKSEVWFLDRALNWHYLADTFSDYFRLMVTNLGLPHWHYAFTDCGLPPQAKQWFHLYAPTRLELNSGGSQGSEGGASTGLGSRCAFDSSKVFKGKNEKKKQAAVATNNPSPNLQNNNQNRNAPKKAPVSSARSVGSSGAKPTSSLSSQALVKSSR